MRKLILTNFQSPGDIVMLTAAVRDLHLCYPNQFITDVRTPCPQLWENNPYITPIRESEGGVEIIRCEYPLIHKSNFAPYHFIHGFIDFLNERLHLHIKPAVFKGDIYLRDSEKQKTSQVKEITGEDTKFWIIVSGGKFDFTAKWWSHESYQQVVDHFWGKLRFVQIGENHHYHPPLRNVIDLK